MTRYGGPRNTSYETTPYERTETWAVGKIYFSYKRAYFWLVWQSTLFSTDPVKQFCFRNWKLENFFEIIFKIFYTVFLEVLPYLPQFTYAKFSRIAFVGIAVKFRWITLQFRLHFPFTLSDVSFIGELLHSGEWMKYFTTTFWKWSTSFRNCSGAFYFI